MSIQSQSIDEKKDIIPLYADKNAGKRPSKLKLGYDLCILIAIVVDLTVILFDQVMMSAFMAHIAVWVGFEGWLAHYATGLHLTFGLIGGTFTLFLFCELLVRWLVAIYRRTYYRWFFFPFVHWYEVLGCFPLLRPFRLLRALVLIKRLHELGVQVLPKRWIKTAQFYGHIVIEELSDRVILTAIANFRHQLASSDTHATLIERTLSNNRKQMAEVIEVMLRRELAPRLSAVMLNEIGAMLPNQVGVAVEQAIAQTPELRRYLKLIPIAGGMIESQISLIGSQIGQNVTTAINNKLFSPSVLDVMMREIAQGLADIDTTRPELKDLVLAIVEDGLSAFEAQVKIQQWKHSEHLSLAKDALEQKENKSTNL